MFYGAKLNELFEKYTIDFASMSAFKLGAKYQAERMYSEKEIYNLLKFFIKDTRGDKPWVDADNEWFEQFNKTILNNKI